MAADLTLYVDPARSLFVAGPGSLQPLAALSGLVQADNINVNAEFLELTGNGLAPYSNIDPTGWQLQFGIGYITTAGAKALIALSTSTALTAVSAATGGGAATALTFPLNLATTAAAILLDAVYSSPIWAELLGNPAPTATSAYVNKVQIQGTIKTGFLGVGLPVPI